MAMDDKTMSSNDSLARLADVIESRKPANGGDPDKSYVSRLLHKGPDAFLKKIGDEATEVVMAAKDVDHGADKSKLVYEVADLWFHSMVALAHYGLTPADVLTELERREGTSGIEEKALRKAVAAVLPGAQASALLLVIALVIDLIKRSDAEGTWQANHFSWRIRSTIWAGVLYVVTAPLWLLLIAPGWIAWGLISLWFLYRIVRGMLAMSKNQAVDA